MLFLLYSLISRAEAFTAYDCANFSAPTEAYSLLEPEPCIEDAQEYRYEKTLTVEILQMKAESRIPVIHCKAFSTIRSQYCGHSSAAGTMRVFEFRKTVDISAEDCRVAGMTKRLTIHNHVIDVQIGTTAQVTFAEAGSLSDTHACTTDKFFYEGVEYSNQVVTHSIEVSVTNEDGKLHEISGLLTLPSGIQAPKGDRSVRDSLEGTYVWDVSLTDCKDLLVPIYYGEVTVHTNDLKTLTGSLVVLEDHETNQYAGLELQSAKIICGYPGYQSHIAGIALVFHPLPESRVTTSKFVPEALSEVSKLESEISFLHVKMSMGLQERLRQVKGEICENRRGTASARLEAIAGSNNPYSLRKTFGRGHLVVKAGATAYVTTCLPVEVIPTVYHNCTEEIPVLFRNKTVFVDPLSFVIRSTGTVVVCNDIAPPRWEIAGAWYCSYPDIRECHTPRLLPIDPVNISTSWTTSTGLGRSIYSEEQIRSFNEFKESAGTRSAYLADAASTSLHSRGPNGEWGPGLSGWATGNILGLVGVTFVPLYWIVGPVSTWVLFFLFFFGALNLVLQISVRAMVISKTRGFGIWILMAFWGVLYQLTISPFVWMEARTTKLASDAVRGTAPPEEVAETSAQVLLEDNKTNEDGWAKLERLNRLYPNV